MSRNSSKLHDELPISQELTKRLKSIMSTQAFTSAQIEGQFLALRSLKQIVIYNSTSQISRMNILTENQSGHINLYYYKIIILNEQPYLLVVYTDRICVYLKSKVMFQIKIPKPLYRYQKFAYDPVNHYFCILGTTISDNFTLVLLVKLFDTKYNPKESHSKHLLQLTLDYKSILYLSGKQFSNISTDNKYIDNVAFFDPHKLVLYNQGEQELYICNILTLFQVYNKNQDLKAYNDNYFRYDEIQDSLPFQGIESYYCKVKAQEVSTHKNRLILTQDVDPISGVQWREQYLVDPNMNLRFLNCIQY